MLPEQKAYIFAWVDGIVAAGFRAGIYCSGMISADEEKKVVTAEDIRQSAGSRKIVDWASNDACPLHPDVSFPRALQVLQPAELVLPRYGSLRNQCAATSLRRGDRGCTSTLHQLQSR